MRRRVSWLLLAAAALASAPCGAEIAITGTVRTDGGAPLAGASVELLPVRSAFEAGLDALAGRLEPEAVAGVVTGQDGLFELAAPEPGLWAVRAAAPGFVPTIAPLGPLVEELTLPEVTLSPDAGLAVRVRGPGGDPVAGAMVMGQTRSPNLWLQLSAEGRHSWLRADSTATTDGEGYALLPRAAGETLDAYAFAPGLAPGRARAAGPDVELTLLPGRPGTVEVVDAGGRPVPGALVVFGAPSWPLGRTGEDGRLRAALPAGRALRAISPAGGRGRALLDGAAEAISLTLSEPPRIHGGVIDETSRLPIAGALVWTGAEAEHLTRTDGGGRFALPDEPERRRFVFQAWAPGYSAGLLQASAGRPLEPILALRPAAAASGEVVDASGDPVVGATVTARLVPAGDRPMRFPAQKSRVRSRAGGRFRLGGIEPGFAVVLEASAAGHAPASLRLTPLEAHETRAGARLVLGPGASLSGRLVAGAEPVAGAELSLLPEPETPTPVELYRGVHPDEVRAAASDADGRFEFAHLTAGSYRLRVIAAGWAPSTVPGVTLPDSGATDLGDLELEPGAEITGRVVDDAGRPVAGAEIRATSRDPQRISSLGPLQPAVVTGADGNFVVHDRRRGERVDIDVHVASPRFLPAGAAAVEAPNAKPLRIVLERAARVSGTVVDPTGAPVADASIFLKAEAKLAAGATMSASDDVESQGRSDAAGRFRFERAPAGILRLGASAEGWIGAELSGLEVPPGGELTGLRLVLERGATVTGRVLDAEGRPVTGVSVGVWEPPSNSRLPGVTSVRTGGDGAYTLEGVAPGLHLVFAESDASGRAAREVEVVPGVNLLDLRLGATGVAISGRVVDAGGSPVPGAMVELLDPSWVRSGPGGHSAEDGGFVIAGVRDGRYLVRASCTGYAVTTRREPLEVAGLPVSGIEVELSRGGTITGDLLGLEPAQRALVTVVAGSRPYDFSLGTVRHDGSYRILNLDPGVWDVRAAVPDGPQARGRVTLEPAVEEARLDLDFSSGLTLAGRVVSGQQAVPGVDVLLRGGDVDYIAGSTTDVEGGFRLLGLDPGRYRLEVHSARGLLHREEIGLESDRDIQVEVQTGRIAGRVLEADGSTPVAGAAVSLAPQGDGIGESPGDRAWGPATDAQGRFVVGELAAGDYRLRIVKEGYAPAERWLRLPPGGSLEDLALRLEPSGGLRLTVRGPTGAPVPEIYYAVLDTNGRMLTDGYLLADENGGVRLRAVPAGSFDVLVAAPGSAVSRLRAASPGPALEVRLEPSCALEVSVAELASEQIVATMRIFDASGRRFIGLERGQAQPQWQLRFGSRSVARLPAGAYRVEVSSSDGRRWLGRVRVAPGGPARLEL